MPIVIREKLAEFFNGYIFPIFIAFCVTIGHVYNLLSLGITLIIVSAALGFLFCKDLKFFIPILLYSYFIISKESIESESLYSESALSLYYILGAILIASIIIHFIIYRKNVSIKRFTSSSLCLGFILISVAFILNGALSLDTYNVNNIIFGTLIAISFILPFFLICINTDFDKNTIDYLAYVLIIVTFILLFQVIFAYKTYVVILSNGSIYKESLNFGWGVSNNIGSMIGMLMPAHFYFASTKKHSIFHMVLGSMCYVGIIFTLSRASILVSTIGFVLCIIVTCISNRKSRFSNLLFVGLLIVSSICVIFKFYDKIQLFFGRTIESGIFNDSGRFEFYINGIEKFKQHPLLGVGFGNSHGINESFIIAAPQYFHNTIIQILASCGILGMIAYLFHRVQTVILFIKNRSLASFFMGMSILTLLLTSLLDIHMFNIFPAILNI